MTLEELLETCSQSSVDDWNVISCWGAHSGPSYLGRVEETTPDENTREESHSMRAAYRTDLSIGIGWGFTSLENWHEDWLDVFPDKGASSHFVDFFYNGMLVEREIYISVDGGRANIPLPTRDMTITQWQYDFFRVLDRFERQSDFDRYLQQAGISVR